MMIRVLVFLNLIANITWARTEVALHAQTQVSPRASISLADIAEVKDADEKFISELASVVIISEKIVNSKTFTSREMAALIKNEIRKNNYLNETNPAFKIPEQVEIKISAAAVSKEEVERKILNIARTHCLDCQYQVQLQNVPTMKSANWNLELSNLPLKGSFLVSIQPTDGQVVNTQQWVTGQIKVSKLVPVMNRFIIIGERISKKDISLVSKDITMIRDNIMNVDEIDGQIMARPLSAGAILMTNDLRREPAAKKGQSVKIISGDSAFEVSMNGTADENGFVGDIIKVKAQDSQKMLSGIIVEKGVVKLQ